MESIVAEMISYLTEDHELLSAHRFEGRPGRITEDAMIISSETMQAIWKKLEIYFAVFMDVAGAFNNEHHDRLIHNLRKRRIRKYIAKWISSFLENRITQLGFNDTTSQPIPTPSGI